MGGRRGDADTRMTCRQKAEMVTEENASQELRRLQREKERAKSRRLAPPLSHPVTRDALSFTRLETQRVQAMAPGCLRGTSSADHRVSRRWLPPLVLRLVLLLQLTSHSVSDARRLTHSLSRMATAGAQQQRRWRASGRGREGERAREDGCLCIFADTRSFPRLHSGIACLARNDHDHQLEHPTQRRRAKGSQ